MWLSRLSRLSTIGAGTFFEIVNTRAVASDRALVSARTAVASNSGFDPTQLWLVQIVRWEGRPARVTLDRASVGLKLDPIRFMIDVVAVNE